MAHGPIHRQIEEITRRIERAPRSARLFLQRGELHRLHGELQHALSDYAAAERLDAKLAAVHVARGRLYFENGQYREAEEALNHLDALPVEGVVLRARTLSALGRTKEAVAEWERAAALSEDPGPEFYLEWSRAVHDPVPALAILDAGISRLGPIVSLELPAIDLELQRRTYDAALARIDLLMMQSTRKELWLMRKGEILLQANRKAGACAAFEEARRALADLPDARKRTRATMALEQQLTSAQANCRQVRPNTRGTTRTPR